MNFRSILLRLGLLAAMGCALTGCVAFEAVGTTGELVATTIIVAGKTATTAVKTTGKVASSAIRGGGAAAKVQVAQRAVSLVRGGRVAYSAAKLSRGNLRLNSGDVVRLADRIRR